MNEKIGFLPQPEKKFFEKYGFFIAPVCGDAEENLKKSLLRGDVEMRNYRVWLPNEETIVEVMGFRKTYGLSTVFLCDQGLTGVLAGDRVHHGDSLQIAWGQSNVPIEAEIVPLRVFKPSKKLGYRELLGLLRKNHVPVNEKNLINNIREFWCEPNVWTDNKLVSLAANTLEMLAGAENL